MISKSLIEKMQVNSCIVYFLKNSLSKIKLYITKF